MSDLNGRKLNPPHGLLLESANQGQVEPGLRHPPILAQQTDNFRHQKSPSVDNPISGYENNIQHKSNKRG
ncbi:MAG: hypothetical protein IZT55_00170 [Anaerolineae bacterium]|nr:hypothetical protein [Anaerolineae bacterium]